ncbi:MAG: mechanosensitive ion channel family protein [Hyphomonadaceae bacterium]
MDFNQQLTAFREWAFHFDGPSQRWMWSAIAILVGYGIGALVSRLLRFIGRKLAGLAKHKEGDAQPKTADHVMIDVLGALIRAAFLLVALAIAANLLFGYSLDEARALAVSALKGLAILIGVWFVGSWLGSRVRKFGHKVGRRATSGGETLFNFLAALVRFGAFAIGLIAALQQFGFDTASLLAVIGAAGLAIALALQDTLKAVAAGVVIAIFRPFKIGDNVRIAGQDGTVADITPFTTVLNTVDNREIVITNDKVWGDVMVNSSARSLRRLDLLLSIDYDDNAEEAMRIVSGILNDDRRVRDEPPVWVKVVELASSSVDLRARAWVSNADWWEVRCDTLLKVKQAFDKAGITIPYPHQVTVQKGDPHSLPPEGPGAKVKNAT